VNRASKYAFKRQGENNDEWKNVEQEFALEVFNFKQPFKVSWIVFTVLHLITANGPDVRHVTVFISKVYIDGYFMTGKICFLIADQVFVLIIPQKVPCINL
jgi:hypothetical protein